MTYWSDKKITVLGLGKTGFATARYLQSRGAQVLVSEGAELNSKNQAEVDALRKLGVQVEAGGHRRGAIEQAEIVVTSPGIKPTADPIAFAYEQGKEVICDIEIAFRDTQIPIVAVTGTNGKSTTTAWIGFILNQHGAKAVTCGNIGVPVLDALLGSPEYLVIEVSSYQLFYTNSFAPMVAVWTNLTPDHLDWHGSLVGYTDAKRAMFLRQSSGQFAVLNFDDAVVAATQTRAKIVPFSRTKSLSECESLAALIDHRICYKHNGTMHDLVGADELKVIGQHNLENALAAVAVVAVLGLPTAQIASGLRSFSGLEHRIEYVDTVDGVPCYNDSKATNPESAIKALEAFKEKIVLIAGGKDKHTSLDEFVATVRKHASAVILLGEAKERFQKTLTDGGVQNIYTVETMEEAVNLGLSLNAGPLVLSPACASFDMFQDFEDRGVVFKDIVRSRHNRSVAAASKK